MRFQAVNRCLMASVWWASDFRLSSLGLILVVGTSVRDCGSAAQNLPQTLTSHSEGASARKGGTLL